MLEFVAVFLAFVLVKAIVLLLADAGANALFNEKPDGSDEDDNDKKSGGHGHTSGKRRT